MDKCTCGDPKNICTGFIINFPLIIGVRIHSVSKHSQNQTNYEAFLALGVVFFIIGLSTGSPLFVVGLVFIALGLQRRDPSMPHEA